MLCFLGFSYTRLLPEDTNGAPKGVSPPVEEELKALEPNNAKAAEEASVSNNNRPPAPPSVPIVTQTIMPATTTTDPHTIDIVALAQLDSLIVTPAKPTTRILDPLANIVKTTVLESASVVNVQAATASKKAWVC